MSCTRRMPWSRSNETLNSYFPFGNVYKSKAFKSIVLVLHVSLSHPSIYPPKIWSLQSNVVTNKGTTYRDITLSNQWTRGKSSPLLTIILILFTKCLPNTLKGDMSGQTCSITKTLWFNFSLRCWRKVKTESNLLLGKFWV